MISFITYTLIRVNRFFKHIPIFFAKDDMTDSLSKNLYFYALRENLKISAAHKDIRWYRDKLRFIIKDLIRWEKNKNTYIKILRLGR